MVRSNYKPGDWVVFRKQKHTTRPGARAKQVYASSHGESYTYLVDKCWIVVQVFDDGRLKVRTRTGKTHVVDNEDVNLRRATLWDRIRYHSRFAQLRLPQAAAE